MRSLGDGERSLRRRAPGAHAPLNPPLSRSAGQDRERHPGRRVASVAGDRPSWNAQLPRACAGRALIVEDDPSCGSVIEEMLGAEGWRCTTARSGGEALAQLGQAHFDLVIVDCSLTDGCGLDLVREIRSGPAHAGVPIVACTGTVDAEMRAAALDAGCDGFVAKPFSYDELVGEVTRVARSSSAVAAIQLPPPLPDGWHVVVVDRGPLFDLAAHLEYEIFLAEGFCEPSPRRIVEDFEPWADRTVYHVVIDDDWVPVGVVRTLTGPLDDLPAGKLERTGCPAPDPVCEYASLAVTPQGRKAGVVEALHRSVWAHARCTRARGLVAIVEPWLHDFLRDHYGFAFEPFGPLAWYMGGEVLPIGGDLAALESELEARRPEFLAWLCAPYGGQPPGVPVP